MTLFGEPDPSQLNGDHIGDGRVTYTRLSVSTRNRCDKCVWRAYSNPDHAFPLARAAYRRTGETGAISYLCHAHTQDARLFDDEPGRVING